jgi:hypothetical protein
MKAAWGFAESLPAGDREGMAVPEGADQSAELAQDAGAAPGIEGGQPPADVGNSGGQGCKEEGTVGDALIPWNLDGASDSHEESA